MVKTRKWTLQFRDGRQAERVDLIEFVRKAEQFGWTNLEAEQAVLMKKQESVGHAGLTVTRVQ